jgi:hypothetical protein
MEPVNEQGKSRLVRQVVIDISVLVAIGLVFAVLAPLGSGHMSLAHRIAYWVSLAVAGYVFYKPIGAQIVPLSKRLDLPEWFMWSASVAIATVPMATLVWIVNAKGGPVSVPPLDVALVHYGAVLVIGAIVTLLFNLLPATRGAASGNMSKAGASAGSSVPAVAPAPQHGADASIGATPLTSPNPLFDQLPASLGSDVIALEMEDHYVRVHTALGSELVLMRLRDAVACMSGIEGRQVHRSWWVARLAVEDVKREGRNIRLVLPRGIEAPVARAQVSELRDAGWI